MVLISIAPTQHGSSARLVVLEKPASCQDMSRPFLGIFHFILKGMS